jgi:hypothetical protein
MTLRQLIIQHRQQRLQKDLISQSRKMKSIREQSSETRAIAIIPRAQHRSLFRLAGASSYTLLHERLPEVNENNLLVFELGYDFANDIAVLGSETLVSCECLAFLGIFGLEMDFIDGRRSYEDDSGILCSD